MDNVHEYNDLHEKLDEMEVKIDLYEGNLKTTSPNIMVYEAMRDELTKLGMNTSCRDQFIAYTDIRITTKLAPSHLERVMDLSRRMVRVMYTFFNGTLHFNDEAIAIMGKDFHIHLTLEQDI